MSGFDPFDINVDGDADAIDFLALAYLTPHQVQPVEDDYQVGTRGDIETLLVEGKRMVDTHDGWEGLASTFDEAWQKLSAAGIQPLTVGACDIIRCTGLNRLRGKRSGERLIK